MALHKWLICFLCLPWTLLGMQGHQQDQDVLFRRYNAILNGLIFQLQNAHFVPLFDINIFPCIEDNNMAMRVTLDRNYLTDNTYLPTSIYINCNMVQKKLSQAHWKSAIQVVGNHCYNLYVIKYHAGMRNADNWNNDDKLRWLLTWYSNDMDVLEKASTYTYYFSDELLQNVAASSYVSVNNKTSSNKKHRCSHCFTSFSRRSRMRFHERVCSYNIENLLSADMFQQNNQSIVWHVYDSSNVPNKPR